MGRLRSYRALAWLYVMAIVFTHLFFLWKVRDRIVRGDPDFTVYYTAAKIIREGRAAQLYDAHAQLQVQREFTNDADVRHSPLPYIHPSFEALLFLPLTFLDYPEAFALWNLLNLGLLFCIAWLLRRFVFLKTFEACEIAFGCLAFFPVFANFHQGQDAILLLLVFVLGFRALEKGSDAVAGCWYGLGIFKYHLVLPLFVILAFWRGRRFIFGFAAVASFAAVISVAVVGWQGTLRYPGFTWHVLSHGGFGRIPASQLPNVLGLIAGWPLFDQAGRAVQMAVFACSIALIVTIASLRSVKGDPESFRLGFACALVVALLVAYSTNTYDLSLLLLPFAIVSNYCFRVLSKRTERLRILLPVAPLLISPLWFWIWLKWQRTNVIAVFLLLWIYFIRKQILRLGNGSEMLTVASFATAAETTSANKTE